MKRQDRTGQDRTGQDRTGQDRTGQDRTGQDRAGQGRAGQGRAEQKRPVGIITGACVPKSRLGLDWGLNSFYLCKLILKQL